MVIDYNFRFDHCMKYIKHTFKMIYVCTLCDIHSVTHQEYLAVYRGYFRFATQVSLKRRTLCIFKIVEMGHCIKSGYLLFEKLRINDSHLENTLVSCWFFADILDLPFDVKCKNNRSTGQLNENIQIRIFEKF